MPKKIYIFRHGMTQQVRDNVSYGKAILTAPIIEEGMAAIERMAEYLKTVPDSLNLSSELVRCRQTVEIVERVTGKDFQFDPRLNEYSGFVHESPIQFYRRIRSVFAETAESTFENIIICTHSAGISALIKLISGSRWPWFLQSNVVPGVLILTEGRDIQKLDFNSNPFPVPKA